MDSVIRRHVEQGLLWDWFGLNFNNHGEWNGFEVKF